MKRITTIVIVAIFGAVLFYACNKKDDVINQPLGTNDMPCVSQHLKASILAFYPFSNGSIQDFSWNGHGLINKVNAVPTSDRNGNPDCAYLFDNLSGTLSYLSMANTKFLNGLSQYSVSLWYMPLDTSRPGGMYEALVSRDTGGHCPDRMGQWSLGLYDCRKIVFGRYVSVWEKPDTTYNCIVNVYKRTNVWHHAVATFNSATRVLSLYLDGVLQSQAIDDKYACSSINDIGDLFLGYKYTGVLDDVILFNKELSQAEVSEVKSMGACCVN